MKFSQWMITAFVGTQQRQHHGVITSTTSSRPLHLFVPSPTLPAYEVPKIEQQQLSQQPQPQSISLLENNIREWLVPSAVAAETTATTSTAAGPPTADEIKLLREAFATFYGVDRDLIKAENLLSQAIKSWDRQPPDERAGLFRVRGDCYMVRGDKTIYGRYHVYLHM